MSHTKIIVRGDSISVRIGPGDHIRLDISLGDHIFLKGRSGGTIHFKIYMVRGDRLMGDQIDRTTGEISRLHAMSTWQ